MFNLLKMPVGVLPIGQIEQGEEHYEDIKGRKDSLVNKMH